MVVWFCFIIATFTCIIAVCHLEWLSRGLRTATQSSTPDPLFGANEALDELFNTGTRTSTKTGRQVSNTVFYHLNLSITTSCVNELKPQILSSEPVHLMPYDLRL